ncbi:MAG: hypothetical protein U9O95_08930 [Candidatus Marinimicrobia bacterium]|nr:hypothetical protein [Candidatus Neomarinimicrobiota bacterium]
MKKIVLLSLSALLMLVLFTGCGESVMAVETETVFAEDTQIPELAKAGGAVDEYGYNYNAHMYKGNYFNSYAEKAGFPPYEGDDEAYLAANPAAANHWAWPYRDVQLLMKWNEAWLSRDKVRHEGYDSYIGSGAWLTNHQSGGDKKDHWTYFCKIVAAPADADMENGVWYTADGVEIGPVIWGSFALIQEVESGLGATYVSPAGPGLGKW